MSAEGYDHLFKLLLVGDAGVGKSSLLLRFTDGTFNAHQPSTIGVDFKVKMLKSGGKTVKLTIWDTAGQERFRTLTSSYYRGAQGILLVYDVTRRETFDNLARWLSEVEMFCPDGGRNTVKLLVGNKADLDSERAVSTSDGAEWARSKGMLFLESSAKTEKCVQQAFNEVVQKIMENPALLASTVPPREKVAVGGGGAGGAGGGGNAPSTCC